MYPLYTMHTLLWTEVIMRKTNALNATNYSDGSDGADLAIKQYKTEPA